MRYMFGGSEFNQDISSWDMSGVTSVSHMFSGALNFNQDLSGWSVGHMTSCLNFDANTPQWVLPKPNFVNCTP